jgi:hypothetical protein
VPVQLRFVSGLSSADYVTAEGWRQASLEHCPMHPQGGCGFVRHGTYARVRPPGTRIARWYCRPAHCTFSLLPDHLAARFPGTLSEIEQVVAAAEQAKSLEAAADELRPDDISLPSAMRWTRRRVHLVHTLLEILIGVLPQLLLGCAPTLDAFRARLGCKQVLVQLRETAPLQQLPRPVGFRFPPAARGSNRSFQQHSGPDPPALMR